MNPAHPERGETSAPLFVDALIASETFPIVRCSYLTVETDDPAPNWNLGLGTQLVPILLLGMAGIVVRPLEGARFTRPQDFDELVNTIEGIPGWRVESSDVWFPTGLFERPEPGEVYRVELRLLSVALRYRTGMLHRLEFTSLARELARELQISTEETAAFQAWHASVLERRPVEKNPEFGLGTRGEA